MTTLPNPMEPQPKKQRSVWIVLTIIALGLIFLILMGLTYLQEAHGPSLVPVSMQSTLQADYNAARVSTPVELSGLPLIAQALYDSGAGDVVSRLSALQEALQNPVPSVTPGAGETAPPAQLTPSQPSLTPTPTQTPAQTPTGGPPALTLTRESEGTPEEVTATAEPTATVIVHDQAPGFVTLVSPEGEIIANPPEFHWVPAERALSYAFSLTGPDGSIFKNRLESGDLGCGAEDGLCIYAPGLNLEGDASYIFNVIAVNNQGYGPISQGMMFSLVTGEVDPPGPVILLNPMDGESSQDLTPTLSWQVSEGAHWYRVNIRTLDGDVVDKWISSGEACDAEGLCSMNVSVSLDPGSYSWTVMAYNPGGYGPLTRPFRLDLETLD